jgi:hypothetical protein
MAVARSDVRARGAGAVGAELRARGSGRLRASRAALVALALAAGTGFIAASTLVRSERFPGVTDAAPVALVRQVTVDLGIAPLVTRLVPRDGIRNGGFEDCAESDADQTGNLGATWGIAGRAQAVAAFGEHGTETAVGPSEGRCMARLSAGGASGSEGRSVLRQRFVVPAGARTLRFDFTLAAGPGGDSVFGARLVTPRGTERLVEITGDAADRGRWRTAAADVSAWSSTDAPTTVELVFTVGSLQDAGATHALIDNVRFGTLWLDAKIFEGASADHQRIEADVRQATRILSQAGVNVRLRRVQRLRDPGGLLDVDITWRPGPHPCPVVDQLPGLLTSKGRQVVAAGRSDVSSDINVYYVRAATRTTDGESESFFPAAGYAITPDGFCHEVRADRNAGVLLMDLAAGRLGVLAHELGHLLVSPMNPTASLEHGIAKLDPFNFMVSRNTPAFGLVNRRQSANINRPGAPFVHP